MWDITVYSALRTTALAQPFPPFLIYFLFSQAQHFIHSHV